MGSSVPAVLIYLRALLSLHVGEHRASRCTQSNKDFTLATKEGQFRGLMSCCDAEGPEMKRAAQKIRTGGEDEFLTVR